MASPTSKPNKLLRTKLYAVNWKRGNSMLEHTLL
jgi:hypothetical protein